MDATWARCLAALGSLAIGFAARGDEPPASPPAPPKAPAEGTSNSPGLLQAAPIGTGAGEDAPKESKPTAKAPEKVSPRTVEARALRARTAERLKRLSGAAEKEVPAGGKALREVLEERLRWLDEWEKAEAAREAAEHPEPSPERQAAEWKAELERIKTLYRQASQDHDALLPSAFRNVNPATPLSDAARAEMKDALDAARGELKEWSARLDKLRAEQAEKPVNPVAALRAERDKIFQRITTLKTRGAERQAAVDSARTRDDADLARERLVNFDWESRVENERLQAQEALIALEAKRTDLASLNLQVHEARTLMATRTLDRIQARYKTVADRQERDLEREAASEQKRAAATERPLDRYQARRAAELLKLKAQVVKEENALATSSHPSLEEQKRLADRAAEDCASLKRLLDDGKVSHLDALRLNNDFRRIGPERDRIKARELAAAAGQLAYYENALSNVEMEMIDDARIDRIEFENLLELLPAADREKATETFQDLETRHTILLERRRQALENLARRAEQTHEQIERRLRTLDEQYGFIRTHIFWVRDQDPVGALTLAQARGELFRAARALVRMVLEVGDRTLWGRVSAEFVAGLLALAGLPWPLFRARRALAGLHALTAASPP
jgi:potassium efflux system protein